MAPASNKLFMGKLDQRAEGNQKLTMADSSNWFNVLERIRPNHFDPRVSSALSGSAMVRSPVNGGRPTVSVIASRAASIFC